MYHRYPAAAVHFFGVWCLRDWINGHADLNFLVSARLNQFRPADLGALFSH